MEIVRAIAWGMCAIAFVVTAAISIGANAPTIGQCLATMQSVELRAIELYLHTFGPDCCRTCPSLDCYECCRGC